MKWPPRGGRKEPNRQQRLAESLSLIISKARLFNKCREQLLRERIVPPTPLRMPLHADDEAALCVFHRLDHAVRRDRHRQQISSGYCDRLMMVAVDVHFRPACEFTDQAVFLDSHAVARGRLAVIGLMWDRLLDQCRNILNKRTTPVDVQALDSETNPEERQIPLLYIIKDCEIRRVALGIELAEFRMNGRPIMFRIDVRRAPRQKNALNPADIFANNVAIVCCRNHQGQTAGPQDRIQVMPDLADIFSFFVITS